MKEKAEILVLIAALALIYIVGYVSGYEDRGKE